MKPLSSVVYYSVNPISCVSKPLYRKSSKWLILHYHILQLVIHVPSGRLSGLKVRNVQRSVFDSQAHCVNPRRMS